MGDKEVEKGGGGGRGKVGGVCRDGRGRSFCGGGRSWWSKELIVGLIT